MNPLSLLIVLLTHIFWLNFFSSLVVNFFDVFTTSSSYTAIDPQLIHKVTQGTPRAAINMIPQNQFHDLL
jgi:hypothetical protein